MSRSEFLSTRKFFLDLVREHTPELEFRGKTRADFEKWRGAFLERFRECLGRFPAPVPLTHEVQWEIREEGLVKQKVLLSTAAHTTVPAVVLAPDHGRPKRAIVAIHGHGVHGKDPVVGARYPEAVQSAACFRYDYGLLLAKEGFAVIAPDVRPFGERGDRMPGERPIEGRDPCNVHAIKGWLLGFNLLTYNLWDLMKCLDFMLGREDVLQDGVGAIGLSGGGAHVMHLAAVDERIKATDVVCALNSYRGWGIGIDNFCGTQFLPGMFKYGDHAEICGLIAPRALMVEMGGFDYGFPIEHSIAALRRLEGIYAAAGCPEKLSSHLGYAGHQFYNPDVAGFFRRWLPGAA
jgi:dienelactone hydrolase